MTYASCNQPLHFHSVHKQPQNTRAALTVIATSTNKMRYGVATHYMFHGYSWFINTTADCTITTAHHYKLELCLHVQTLCIMHTRLLALYVYAQQCLVCYCSGVLCVCVWVWLLLHQEWMAFVCPQLVLSQMTPILLSLLIASMITITLLLVIVHLLVLMRKERQVHNKERCVLVSLLHGGCDHPACTYAN